MPTPKWLFNLPCDKIYKISQSLDLDWYLVSAICMVESSGDVNAWRYEPQFKGLFETHKYAQLCHTTEVTEVHGQMFSYGLMQVMGATLRRLNFSEPFAKAFDPTTNLHYGATLLTQLKRQYSDMNDVIAAYNAGKPRKNAEGFYLNQAYVDKVLKLYNEL